MTVLRILIWWILLPLLIFWFGFQEGLRNRLSLRSAAPQNLTKKTCNKPNFSILPSSSMEVSNFRKINGNKNFSFYPKIKSINFDKKKSFIPSFNLLKSKIFHRYRFDYMGDFQLLENTLVEERNSILTKNLSSSSSSSSSSSCSTYANIMTSIGFTYAKANRDESCVAIVRTTNERASQPILRFKPPLPHMKGDPGAANGKGFFTKVSIARSRLKTSWKFRPFMFYYDDMIKYVHQRLSFFKKKNVKDLIVMVVNEGELDLFLNFMCSISLHNIDLIANIVVFCGSEAIVSLVDKTGAIGLYHKAFAAVSKSASNNYLDFTFVDMMWYKCFSIFLILREGFNVLFQDVDVIWLRNPFQYFDNIFYKDDILQKNFSKINKKNHIEAILSDDAQRSLRYTPFFANSGFYYLRNSLRTIYFSWSIMTSFPMIQRLGSHQNMYTQRLLELSNIFGLRTYLLPLEDFPNGYLYHHGRTYMKKLKDKKVHPYFYHMCWTAGKTDKLKYMKMSGMWYLNDTRIVRKEYEKNFKKNFRKVQEGVKAEEEDLENEHKKPLHIPELESLFRQWRPFTFTSSSSSPSSLLSSAELMTPMENMLCIKHKEFL